MKKSVCKILLNHVSRKYSVVIPDGANKHYVVMKDIDTKKDANIVATAANMGYEIGRAQFAAMF